MKTCGRHRISLRYAASTLTLAQSSCRCPLQEEYEKATFNNAQSPAVEKLAKKVSADTKSAEAGDAKYQVRSADL